MRTTNVYIIADLSYGSAKFIKQIQQFIIKANRACLSEQSVQLHIIGFNDKAKILLPFESLKTQGNPNFTKALDLLSSIMLYNKKYSPFMTRSIIIWLSSFNILRGYEGAFYKLNNQAEFSRAIRYMKCSKQWKSQGSPNISLFQINEIKNKNDVALR